MSLAVRRAALGLVFDVSRIHPGSMQACSMRLCRCVPFSVVGKEWAGALLPQNLTNAERGQHAR
jgi:hypothetical protein